VLVITDDSKSNHLRTGNRKQSLEDNEITSGYVAANDLLSQENIFSIYTRCPESHISMSLKIGPQTLTLLFVEAAVLRESNQTAVASTGDSVTKEQRNKKRAEDVLPNIHCTQAAENSHHRALSSPRHPIGGHGMVSSTAVRNLQRMANALQCPANGNDTAVFPILSLVTLTFDL